MFDSKGVGPGPERKRYDEEDRREPEQDDKVSPPSISDLGGSVVVDGDRAHASRSNASGSPVAAPFAAIWCSLLLGAFFVNDKFHAGYSRDFILAFHLCS